MTPHTRRTLIACAFTSALFGSNALADDCKLVRLTSLDFTDNGSIMVPVSIEHQQVPATIDTGSAISAVDPVVAKKLGLIEERIPEDYLYTSSGQSFTYMAFPHEFSLGDLHSRQEEFVVWPSNISEDGRTGGIVASDILRHYDIDIDFSAKKLNVFSQDHCPGKVIYWASDNVAVVPMHVQNLDGTIIVPVTLDGHSLDAILDTGSSVTNLYQEAAQNIFGLGPTSPDMTKISDHGPGGATVYNHTFRNLALEGISVANPAIHIFEDMAAGKVALTPHIGSRINGGPDYELNLGLSELRHFHLYIAYKEQKLYISPASAPIAVAASVSRTASEENAPPASAAPTSIAAGSR